MRLHDLFYDISTILGGIENKSFRLLDNVNDNEEKYIITQKKKYSTNYEKVEHDDANDKKKLINCIESISNYRFENLSEVQDFRTRYLFTSSNGTPVDTIARLILKKSWLSDNEIDIGNNISMTKYENNEILHITSLQFDILKTKSVVEEYTKDKDFSKEKIKIYNLFSNDYSNVDLKTEKEQHPSEYVEWKHDCTLISKLLEKGSNSSIVTLNVNIDRNHWIFFAGIDYHKGTETNSMKDDIYIYHFDSNYKSENPSSILNMNNEYCNSKFVSICRLLKLILLFGRSRQLQKNDMIIANDKKILKIKTDLYKKMNLMKDNIIHVTTTYQEDFHTCGLHIIRFFDEIWRIKHSSSEFSKEIFEKQLTESRQLRLHNEENLNLKSELLEHYLNVAFVIGIMTKSLFIDFVKHKFLESNNKQYEFVHSATLDITAEHDKFKKYNDKNAFSRKLRSTKVKESPAQQNYEELSNQVTVYFEDLEKKIDNEIGCQCCPVFPKKQLENMKTNKIQDIHDFDHNVLMNLRWTCPRTTKTGRGAFYTKRLPSKNYPIFEKKSIPELIKIWKPKTLWDFRTEKNDVDGWYKDFLISRLSFNCNFTEIKIPDGGSCSEWLVSTILFSENKESEYGKYLNNLRRLVKIFPYEFSQDKHKTTEEIRLFYAESLYYGYSPNIEELLNLHINDNPTVNELYCSSVLWNLHSICDRNIHKYSKYVFQDCVRKFISMTPLQVGKLGCMWGTEDFLNWFQSLFNIRIFVINIQETDTQKYTTSSFVNELIDKGTQSYEEEHSNDKFFDLSIKNRLVPYGIIIVLMVESHFDRVYKLHNKTSPIIPSGSSEIEFLLPLLKISKTLWSSLNLNSIYQHNSNLISNQTMDINHELNFWFDHQIVFENEGQRNMFKLPVKYPDFSAKPFVENLQNKSSSIPFCSIRFPPKYLAYIIFYNVLQLNEPYNSLLSQINAFSIYLQEEDLETIDNYMQYFKEFIGKQQEYFGKVDNVFHDGKLNNHISDMMEIYKLSLYESSRTKISTKNNLEREDDNNWTKRLQYPLFRNLLNFDQFNKSMLKNNDKITNESKERSLNPEDENKTKDIRKVEISTNSSQPSFSVKLKSSKKSVAKQESTDNEIQIDPQKASNTLLSQSTVNTFNKNLQDNNVEMDPQTGAVDTSISQQTNITHDNDTAAPPSTESNQSNPDKPHVRKNPVTDNEDKSQDVRASKEDHQENNVEMDPQTGAVDTSISQQTNITHDNDTAAPPSTESNQSNPDKPNVRKNPVTDNEDKNEDGRASKEDHQENNSEINSETVINTSIRQQTNITHDNDTAAPPSTESNKPNPENPHVRENPIIDNEDKSQDVRASKEDHQENNVEINSQTVTNTSISQQTNMTDDNDTTLQPSPESNKSNPEDSRIGVNPIKDDEDKNESIQNLGISTKSSKPTIKITLKSTKNSVSNKESTDDVTKMDSQKASDSSMSESTSNSLDKDDEMNNYDEFEGVPSSNENRQENDVSKSLFDTNKTGKVLRFSKENETDFDNLESPIKPNDGEFSGKDPKTEASKLSLEFIKNNNRPGKKLKLSLKNLSENESESESESKSEKTESDDDDSSFFSFSSAGRFDFKLTQVFKTNMDCFAVVSSFESHPIRLDQLKQFQTQQPGSGTGDDHLDKLLLCSKQVHSQKSKQSITYEGMYGFVSKDHFSLVNKNETNISTFRKSPYIWQDLITTQIGQYSKEKAMEYFKGMAEDSKVLIHASTIAWDYLESFFHKEKDSSELFEGINQFIKDQYSFLESKSLKIDYSTKNQNKHKLIGDTPFTSCHVLFWKNVEKKVEFIRSYTDVKTCVLMCFGPKEIIDERITFQLEIENNLCDPIDLVSNTILVFSPKKNKFKIQGNLNFHLILLFCIDETIVKRIQNTFKNNSTKPVTDWYSLFVFQQNKKRKSQSKETKETSSKPENRKNRKRTGSIFSSRRIRLGYIDLEVSQKQEGTKRSCLQDAFINAGFLFGKNIKEEMYKLFPPMEKKNACLEKIIKSPVITQNFELESEQFYTRVPGGNEWRLLHHLQGTGVYIVWGTVQPTNQKKEYHAFVYNSCFSEFNNKKYYGAIIDNRHHSKLRAFSQEDLKDHLTARKSLSDYFGGETRVNNWIRILDKI